MEVVQHPKDILSPAPANFMKRSVNSVNVFLLATKEKQGRNPTNTAAAAANFNHLRHNHVTDDQARVRTIAGTIFSEYPNKQDYRSRGEVAQEIHVCI